MEIEKKDFSDGSESNPKKQWTKPECELIGKDKIQSGDVLYLTEGQTSASRPGILS